MGVRVSAASLVHAPEKLVAWPLLSVQGVPFQWVVHHLHLQQPTCVIKWQVLTWNSVWKGTPELRKGSGHRLAFEIPRRLSKESSLSERGFWVTRRKSHK